jgi:hypothetical protein
MHSDSGEIGLDDLVLLSFAEDSDSGGLPTAAQDAILPHRAAWLQPKVGRKPAVV